MTVLQHSSDDSAAWMRMCASLAITVLISASPWVASVLIPEFQAHFSIDRAAASYPYMMVMAGFFLGTPLWSNLLPKIGMQAILLWCSLLGAASYMTAVISPNLTVFSLSFLGVGVAASVTFAPITADLTFWFRRWRGFAVSIVTGGTFLAALLWLQVIDSLRAKGEWQHVLIALTVAMLLVSPISFAYRRSLNVLRVESQLNAHGPIATGRARLWLLTAAGTICCFSMAMPQVHLVALCLDSGLSSSQGSALVSVLLLVSMGSRFLCAIIIDRIGPGIMLISCSLIQTLAVGLYVMADSYPELWAVTLLFGLAQGGLLPAYPLLTRQLVPSHAASAGIGLLAIGTSAGMILGGWVGGNLFDITASYHLPFTVAAAGNLLTIFLIAGIARGQTFPEQLPMTRSASPKDGR